MITTPNETGSATRKEVMLMQAYIVAVSILTVAAACDLVTKKIPNLIIICGYIIAFTTMFFLNGTDEFYIYIIRALWPIPALFIFYYLRALGAGDIKLFSVISIFIPTEVLIRFIIFSFVIAAIWGILKFIISKELHIKIMGVINHVKHCVETGEITMYRPKGESSYICFSIYMLIGFITSIGMEVLL